MADVTYFFRWGPLDAERLSLSKLAWWRDQAKRIRYTMEEV
ncbi:GpE family phage tail protein [Pandoraea communis]|nr:GpE family phage tail protein [Pandoraea communis]